MKKRRIALVGTYYEESHGDALLFDCVEYLYKKIGKKHKLDIECEVVDILGRNHINYGGNVKQNLKDKVYKNTNLYFLKKIYSDYKRKKFVNMLEKFYLDNFVNVDMIVIVGGGLLKYNIRTNFAPIFDKLINVAKNLDIPVIFNSIGIEGEHNEIDNDYIIIKKALNCDIVKMCSTRDRIDVLEKYIVNSNTVCKKVSDTGVWTSNALKIKKDINSNLIGLNVIVPSRFKDYGKEISEIQLLDFWKSIVLKLDFLGYKYRFFTNGMLQDYKFAEKIIDYCNLDRSLLLDNPKDEFEMVKNISKFKAIIANRLHSCIVAYSLNIPAVGLAWNDKLIYWGNEINLSERFFDYDELNPDNIVFHLVKAMDEGYNQNEKKLFMQTIYEFIEDSFEFLNKGD